MSDDLSIRGELEVATVPDLIRSIIRSSETAILTLEDDAVTSIFFDAGRIVSASTSDPDLALHCILLRNGELDLDRYHAVPESAVVSGRVASVLEELGGVDLDKLMRAQDKQLRDVLHSALLLRRGSYTLDFVEGVPLHVTPLDVNTASVLLDGMRTIDHWSLISRGLGQFDRVLRQVSGATVRAEEIDLTADETHILDLLATPQSIATLCLQSYLSDFMTCRVLWGLLTIGMIEDAADDAHARRSAEAAEYELEGRVEQYNTLFQTIFGIVFQRIGDHIYDFADRVVLQLSPESVPYLSGVNFVNEGRIDFDQVLNNVISSGAHDHARIIEDVLSELLYGWILEIKREFGPEMESEVVALARSLKP